LTTLYLAGVKKHRQLARQEGGFASSFPQAILMVPSSAFVPVTEGERSPGDGFPFGKTTRFGSLEFITD
jgi:hypothetical protein